MFARWIGSVNAAMATPVPLTRRFAHVAAAALAALTIVATPTAAQTSIPAPGFQPSALAYDPGSNILYVAENSGFRRIFAVDPSTGTVSSSFLAPSLGGMDGSGNPNDMAYDGAGHLFVVDIGTGSVGVVFEVDLTSPGGPTIVNQFSLPFRGGAIAFDGTDLYISDHDSSTIIVTDRTGALIRTLPNLGLRPAGLAFDAATGNLFAIGIFDQTITQFGTDGSPVATCASSRAPGVQGLGAITIGERVVNSVPESKMYLAAVTDPDPFTPPDVAGTIHVSNPASLTCTYINPGTNLFGWGANYLGQLGRGAATKVDEPAPVPITTMPAVIGLGAGGTHSLFIGNDGSVRAAGHNGYGQLGNGTLGFQTSCYQSSTHICHATPVQVIGLRGVKAVAGGHLFSLALRSDGTVWSWGSNDSGQLGVGLFLHNSGLCNTQLDCSTVPVQVSGFGPKLTDTQRAVAVAAGGAHAFVVRGDGTLWAWGYNTSGQLGVKIADVPHAAYAPVLVPISDVVSVAASNGSQPNFSVAAKSDGTVWAWGDHQRGTLGSGVSLAAVGCAPYGPPYCASDTPVQVPVPLAAGTKVVQVAAGGTHAAALRSDGTVWTWGNNAVGQLGDTTVTGPVCPSGNSVCRTTPVQVAGLTNVIAIKASALYTIALKSDGSLWTWGTTPGNQGTLGIGETGGQTHPAPKPVVNIAQVGWSGSPPSAPAAFSDAASAAFATGNGSSLALGSVTGSNISVRPLENNTASNEVTLTFSNIVTPGVTTMTRTTAMPSLPSGFRFGNPETFYDIDTTVVFSGPIKICIAFWPSWFPPGVTPTIFHYDQATQAWEALTPAVVTHTAFGSTICADTPSLSPFALLVPSDTVAPRLDVTLSMTTLTPPDHRLVPIVATVTATDNEDPNPSVQLVSIASSEAGDGLGDGDLADDIQDAAVGTDDRTFALRAERSGRGRGRTYTVTYAATDASGNRTTVSRTVVVPHDQRVRRR